MWSASQGWTLPAGDLRESPRAGLRRADVVVLTRAGRVFGTAAYADAAKEILLAFASAYLAYPLHDKNGGTASSAARLDARLAGLSPGERLAPDPPTVPARFRRTRRRHACGPGVGHGRDGRRAGRDRPNAVELRACRPHGGSHSPVSGQAHRIDGRKNIQ